MNLRSHLLQLSGQPDLVVTPDGRLSRRDLLADEETPGAGLRIGVRLSDVRQLILALAVLDGSADMIVLLSTALPSDVLGEVASACELDALLTDRSIDPHPTDILPPCFPSLAALKSLIAPRPVVRPQATRWILLTSGTTGRPKPVSHELAGLTAATKQSQATHGYARWGLLYDLTRFAGLQVLLQALLSGAALIIPPAEATLENRLAFLAQEGCSHLSGTPSLWRKILMSPLADRLVLRQITLGGEIADQKILSAVAARYPDARIAHIFASTEAGVAFSVADGRAGFPTDYLVKPPRGAAIKVEGGRLFVRNQKVASRYLGSEQSFANPDGWVDTGDDVAIVDDRVHFLGRASGVINIGGDKVHPEEVERVLLAHPFVMAARVYARSSPITGQLVAADVVLIQACADTEAAQAAVMQFCRQELGRTRAPALLRLVDEIVVNGGGKLTRSA